VTVTQQAGPVTLTINPNTNWTPSALGGNRMIRVTANVSNWTVSAPTWINVNRNGNDSFVITASVNLSASSRSGTVTVTAPRGPTRRFNVTQAGSPTVRVTGVSISGSTTRTIHVNQTIALEAIVTPNNANNRGVTWHSSNSHIASVNGRGEVRGLIPGTTTIIARTNDGGLQAMVTVNVGGIGNRPGEQFRRVLIQGNSLTHDFITRSTWGASNRDRMNWVEVSNQHSIVLHHTGRTDTASAIDSDHLDGRSFNGIGYHFLIGRNGNLYEGRPLDYVGTHTAGHNTGYIGIALSGDFQPRFVNGWLFAQSPTDEQLETLRELVGLLQGHYGISTNSILRHSDLNDNSVCPGANFPNISELFR